MSTGRGGSTSRGRACPLSYHYRPEDLATPSATLNCSTLYVVGGLYGNTSALRAVVTRAEADADPTPTVVFNGDFHYLDTESSEFRVVDETVAEHHAIQGNIEAELTSGDREGGCGCAYPDYIDDATVGRSNAVVDELYETARRLPDCLARLSGLPRFLTAEVGGLRIAVVHGDPQSLAGWGLALEAVEPGDPAVREHIGWSGPATSEATVADWFRRSRARVIASTHTGHPYAQDYVVDDRTHLVVNNGTAGMGNYQDSTFGVVTRISVRPERPIDSLYGITMDDLRCDALALEYDVDEWSEVFLRSWPPGSPAHASYWDRTASGTFLQVEQSARGSIGT